MLRAAHAGQPTVIHFWGLTCGPAWSSCRNWAALRKPAARPPAGADRRRPAAAGSRAPVGNPGAFRSRHDRELELHRPLLRAPALRDRPGLGRRAARTVMIDGDGKTTVLPASPTLPRSAPGSTPSPKPVEELSRCSSAVSPSPPLVLLRLPACAPDYKLGALEISQPWTRATPPTAPGRRRLPDDHQHRHDARPPDRRAAARRPTRPRSMR